jgi:hypothetical protein
LAAPPSLAISAAKMAKPARCYGIRIVLLTFLTGLPVRPDRGLSRLELPERAFVLVADFPRKGPSGSFAGRCPPLRTLLPIWFPGL